MRESISNILLHEFNKIYRKGIDFTEEVDLFKGQVHSKNNLLSIKAEKSDKPIKKKLSTFG